MGFVRGNFEGTGSEGRRFGAAWVRLLLPVVFLGVGGAGFGLLSRKPPAESPVKPEPKPIEVRARELKREDYQIVVRSQGTIRAHSQVRLTAQVGGRVEKIYLEFEEGAFFREGDVLLELDAVDFEVALATAEAQLAAAEMNYAQEETRANQARLNWEDLGYEEEPNDLVLRKPQLNQARKQLALAKTQVRSARRNLERSKVRAPFDGRVLTRSVGISETIGAATTLGVVFATGYSEVRLPVPIRSLGDLSLPQKHLDAPLEIRLEDNLEDDSGFVWPAKILRTEGALNASTLELFAIARIEDPFGIRTEREPLHVGQPVEAGIPGRILEGVYVIPRDAVRGLNRIRLADATALELQTAVMDPVWSDEENFVIRGEGIEEGTLLVLTRLVHAPDGGKVVIVEDSAADLPFDKAEEKKSKKTKKGGLGKGDLGKK